ncbi:hypothetical protein AC1031_011814 [Aphanomyces cochlioides]|nr:hypothetical protein AC1031_011814 [Aphanomyces cochlioides]
MFDGETSEEPNIAPLRRSRRIQTAVEASPVVNDVHAESSVPSEYLERLIRKLDMDVLSAHFNTNQDDVEPYVICEGVSVRAFNEAVANDEDLPIRVRFIAFPSGQVVITELPTRAHDFIAAYVSRIFIEAAHDRDHYIVPRSTVTLQRPGFPNKEADATSGPAADVPNLSPAPLGLYQGNWVTLAVEGAFSQTWEDLLDNGTNWWIGYPGIQYVLCIKVVATAHRLQYCVYDSALHGLAVQGVVGLTDENETNLVFDTCRILGIAAGSALPPGMPDQIVVDLREIIRLVVRKAMRYAPT